MRGHLFLPATGRGFVNVDTKKPMRDPMFYPLLFPNGDDDRHAHMTYSTTSRRKRDGSVAMATNVNEDEEEQIIFLLLNHRVIFPCELGVEVEIAKIDNEPLEEPEPANKKNNDQQ